jgi:hypothetical protein
LAFGAVAVLRAAYERSLEQRGPPWQNAFEKSPFEPLRHENFEEAMTLDAQTLLALYSTTSSLAALEDKSRTVLLDEVRPHPVIPRGRAFRPCSSSRQRYGDG